MNRTIVPLLAASVLSLGASSAFAQHAGYVLFGEPSQEGLDLPAERKAVAPITSPYYHEDSFITTDLRLWYVNHQFPGSSLMGGGHAQVYALQFRLALTDKLQLVAYKDGYTDIESGLVDDEGWNDLAAGLKWNFLQDWENDLHAAAGIGYQFSVGNDEALQGDQEIRLWGSVNKGFDRLHLGGTLNLLFPVGEEDALGDSTRLFWHAHADYYLTEWFSPVVELNGYHTIDDGSKGPLPFSGVDVANLGGGKGQDVITLGLGSEIRPTENLGLRGAFEFPLTNNNDIFSTRWTFSVTYGF